MLMSCVFCMHFDIFQLDGKFIRRPIIEPDSPNISKAQPDWMKNCEKVADSA